MHYRGMVSLLGMHYRATVSLLRIHYRGTATKTSWLLQKQMCRNTRGNPETNPHGHLIFHKDTKKKGYTGEKTDDAKETKYSHVKKKMKPEINSQWNEDLNVDLIFGSC